MNIEQALKHAKQTLELYGFNADIGYKETEYGYDVKITLTEKKTSTKEYDAEGYSKI